MKNYSILKKSSKLDRKDRLKIPKKGKEPLETIYLDKVRIKILMKLINLIQETLQTFPKIKLKSFMKAKFQNIKGNSSNRANSRKMKKFKIFKRSLNKLTWVR